MARVKRKIYDATGAIYWVSAAELPADAGDAQLVVLVDATGAAITPIGSADLTDLAKESKQLPDGHNVTSDAGTGWAEAVANGDSLTGKEGLVLKINNGSDEAADLLQPLTAAQLTTEGLAKESGGNLAAIKAKTDNIPALGQALAAGSVPVVMTAAQVSTLTPPAAITNFANETGGNLATIAGKDFATSAKQDTGNTSLGTIAGKDFATQTTLSSVLTALQTIDNFISGSRGLVTEDNSAAIKTAVELLDNCISGSRALVTEDNSASIKTAVELIDNIVPTINGPGAPTIDSFTQKAINLAAGANQVLVSSAANKQIWVYGGGFTVNVAGTVSFQDEDDTAITGIMPFGDKGGMTFGPSGNFAMPVWKLGTDKDLEVDVVTSELDGWISYAIVSV